MRYLIANDIPVIIGAAVNDDFSPASYGGQIDANGVWNYKATNNGSLAGHAMCILGYDDQLAGGSFLVRNSWGEGFGIGGNFWLKYADVASVVAEAWCILLILWRNSPTNPTNMALTCTTQASRELNTVASNRETAHQLTRVLQQRT